MATLEGFSLSIEPLLDVVVHKVSYGTSTLPVLHCVLRLVTTVVRPERGVRVQGIRSCLGHRDRLFFINWVGGLALHGAQAWPFEHTQVVVAVKHLWCVLGQICRLIG